MSLLIDILGWVGATCVLVAYFLVSTQRLGGTSSRYQGLNLVGAVGLCVNTVYYTAYPSALLNLVWGLVAVAALYRYRARAALQNPS